MLKPGSDANLAQKAVGVNAVTDVRAQDLDRHLPSMLDVLGEEYHAHPAATELTLDAIAARDSGAKLLH